jgi:hypothetical protein
MLLGGSKCGSNSLAGERNDSSVHSSLLVAAEDVRIPIIGSNTKVHVVRSVPLIFYGLDEQNCLPEAELHRTFISFVAGIAFDLEFHT